MVLDVIVYAVAFLGSVSFGYVVMRAAFPDTRALPRETKLGMSSVLGLTITGLAFLTSLFLREAFLPLIPAYSAALYGFFELRSRYFAPATMRVAVPVVRVEAPAPVIPPKRLRIEEKEVEALEKRMREAAPAKREEIALPEIREKEVPEEAKVLPPKEELLAPEEEMEELEKRLKKPKKEEVMLPEIPGKKEIAIPPKPSEVAVPAAPVPSPPRGPGFLEERRRRYEERRAGREMAPRPEVVSAVAREIRKPRRHREERIEAAAPPAKEELTIEEIAGGLETAGSITELSELEGLGSLGEMETKGEVTLEQIAGLSRIEELPREKGIGCPNCGDLKATIIYCPYDGKAFCTHCASGAQQRQGLVFYGCPHCKKEVVIKKG